MSYVDPAHYELAFEDALRAAGWPYVRVDEQKRNVFDGTSIKSFDFLVHTPGGGGWLVDVKGRKFPYARACSRRLPPHVSTMRTAASDPAAAAPEAELRRAESPGHAWENWVTEDDLAGMAAWQRAFGNTGDGMGHAQTNGKPGGSDGRESGDGGHGGVAMQGGRVGASAGRFEARFVFAYWLTQPAPAAPLGPVHIFRQRAYAFLSVPAAAYALRSRRRSPRWQTRFMPAAAFRQVASPVFGVEPKPLPAAV